MQNKDLIRKRFAHSLAGYDERSVVQRSVCSELDMLIDAYVRDLPEGVGVELGAGTGFLTDHLLRRFAGMQWVVNDLVPQTQEFLDRITAKHGCGERVRYVWGDAETGELPEGIALLASASTFQWFDALDEFLKRVRPKILPGGYVVFSSFGPENFHQVRTASEGRKGFVFPAYETVKRWCLEAGFSLVYSTEYRQPVYFGSVPALLRYMKETGVNGGSDGRWTRAEYREFCRRYDRLFRSGWGMELTYHPVVFILKKQL